MFNKSYRLKIIIGVIILVIGASVILYKNSNSTESFTINYENTSSVKIYDASNSIDQNDKFVNEINKSGENFKAKIGSTYKLRYKAINGFEDGEVVLKTSENPKSVINIKPERSKVFLESILNREQANIQQVLKSTYPKINLYEIQRGKLLENGDWYGTTLKYVGPDELNSDTLRIVLHKEAGSWVIKSEPPNIYLSKFANKNVPEDILKEVNAL